MNGARWLVAVLGILSGGGRLALFMHRRGRSDAAAAAPLVRRPFNERRARWIPAVVMCGGVVVVAFLAAL